MKVTIEHARQLKYCTPGLRYFAKLHNLDFRKLVKEGIEVEELEKINDSMANKLIEIAKDG